VGSLLDGIETAPPPGKASKPASSGGSAQKIKLTLAFVGLAVGGVLIAWNAGVFGDGTAATPANAAASGTPIAPSNPAPAVRKVDPPKAITEQRPQAPQNELIEQRTR
jgi:hypothetical protein